MSKTKEENEYNPIYCDHKRANGFSSYDLLSHGSGSGPNWIHECNISVCLKCGQIKIWGKNLTPNGEIAHFDENFSIFISEHVEAIVKNCNYMNQETEGYIPFIRQKNEHD